MRDNHDISRVLRLRQFPGFADADLADIATVAENVVEDRFAAGDVIAPSGRLPAVHLIVKGAVRSGDREWTPNHVFGALEVMAGRRASEPAIAAEPTQTLRMAAADFAEVLEDSYSILAATRRMLALRLLATERRQPQLLLHGTVHRAYELPREPLGMVDRLILLRQQMTFASARAHALSAIAQASEDVRIPAGTIVARRGEHATRGLVILDGAIQSSRDDGLIVVHGPSDSVGGLEMLAEVAYERTFTTVTPVRALACPAGVMFDVMEDHTDFALGMVSRLAGRLLDIEAQTSAYPYH